MSFDHLENLMTATKPYQNFFRRRKLNAFVLSSLAAFVLLCFVWTLSVRGFSSLANIVVSCSQETHPEHLMQRLVSNEMSDQSLSQHIMIASEKAGIENEHVLNRRFDEIREAFDFQIRKRQGVSEYQISARFSGNGSDGEQLLLKSVVTSLAQKLQTAAVIDEQTELVDQRYEKIQKNIETLAANRQAQLEESDHLVQRLDADLSLLHQQVQQLKSLPISETRFNTRPENPRSDAVALRQQFESQLEALTELQNGLTRDPSSSQAHLRTLENQISQLRDEITSIEATSDQDKLASNGPVWIRNVSHSGNSAVNAALDSIVALDTDSIHTKIGEINHAIRSDAIQQREDVSTLRVLSANVPNVNYNVRSVSRVQNIPDGGVPANAQLMLLGLIAFVFGSVVATFFRPELTDRGFESLEKAESFLGVPIVAEVQSYVEPGSNHETGSLGIANRIAQFSEIALFTVALLLIFICFWYPHIRESFFVNPFHGLTKVAWLLFGK